MKKMLLVTFLGSAVLYAAPAMKLSETGLYDDLATKKPAPGVAEFTPRYPLYTDNAAKKRFIKLPPGTQVDTHDIDRYQFPDGTKLWKEFAFGGKAAETRLMVKEGAQWTFVTYKWRDDGSDADLVGEAGDPSGPVLQQTPLLRHQLPSRADCLKCHGQTGREPVLGYTAFQLTDSLQVHAATQTARDAIGYLHANCAHCHNPDNAEYAQTPYLRHPADLPDNAEEPAVTETKDYIVAGNPASSVLVQKVKSGKMPKLGKKIVDKKAVELLSKWVAEMSGG